MEKYDVVALGELLIDFANKGLSPKGTYLFEANPGGAPCNVLSMLQKLDKKTAFVGKVGKDFLGEFLALTLIEQGIDVKNLRMDSVVPTTLAFVSNTKDGDRSFSFYRNPGADMMLSENEIDSALLKNTRIFHFGTLSMTDDRIAAVTKKAVQLAKENGVMISFDPNLRPPLWDDLNRAKEMMAYGMANCDILKISDNEVEFFTGNADLQEGMEQIYEQFQPMLMCVTLGKDGSIAMYQNLRERCEGFLQETCVDTTGAGDTFMGCMLSSVLEQGIDSFDSEKLQRMLLFANAAASIITTRVGALTQMPQKEEVLRFLKQRDVLI